jgi:hypothetical protein
VRFVPGRGVVASFTLPAARTGRLELFDVAGRRVSSTWLTAAGTAETALPGTALLRAGLYFGRLIVGAAAFTARAVVSR